MQTSLNTTETRHFSLDPHSSSRHRVHITNARTKSHMPPNQHPDTGFIYRDLQPPSFTGPLDLPPKLGLFPKLGPFPIPGRSEFVNTVLTKGSLYRGSRYTSHNTLFQSSQFPALASVPPQPQLQSESNPATPPLDGATPPVDFLYAQIKEHAPFMVGLVSPLNPSFLECDLA